jgi:hypothetical protein
MVGRRMRLPVIFMPVLIIAFLGALSGCSTGGLSDQPASSSSSGASSGGTGGASNTTTPPPPAAAISLGTSAVAVKSDNSSNATITATILDASNAVIEGAEVTFKASGGTISAPKVTTNADGQAAVTFRSGTQNQSNQVVTVTATDPASGRTAQIPIQVTGSTLTMSSTPPVNIPSDGSTKALLTVTAKNAGGVPVYNVPITLTTSGAGSVSLEAVSGNNTDLQDGKIQVKVTGTTAGVVRVTAQGLGTSATYDYTITGPALAVFGITAPPLDSTLTPPRKHAFQVTNSQLTVTVSAPSSANVTFGTDVGAWDGGASQLITKPVVGGVVSATIRSALAGTATIHVKDSIAPATEDFAFVDFFAPSTDAAQISLQSDFSVLGLSTGGLSKTTTLRATVRTSVATGSQPVGNAKVAFSIINPTGGGESITPVIAFTDATGLATATFTSGSVSSSQSGVRISAAVMDATNNPIVTAAPIFIVIGGTPGSVVIGRGSKITIPNPTTYALPMAVLVSDSDGNPVPGAKVSLSLWPVFFSSGVWYNALAYDPNNPDKVRYVPYYSGTFDNDDVNENLTKDPTELSDPFGRLRPPNSAAGALQTPVTTDASGVATFDLVYLKGSAAWITVRVRASTLALGTETSSSITFTLTYDRTEGEHGDLPASLYPVDLTVAAGAAVTYTVPVFSSPYGASRYSTSNINSTITTTPLPGASPIYTFTAPAGTAGTVFNDAIVFGDGGTTGGTAPVRILVQ